MRWGKLSMGTKRQDVCDHPEEMLQHKKLCKKCNVELVKCIQCEKVLSIEECGCGREIDQWGM